MIIKIKSDITGKEYSGNNMEELVAQCEADDKAYNKTLETKKKENELSSIKKELSKEVEKAEDSLTEAYAKYNKLKEEVKADLEKSNKEVAAYLKEATDTYNKSRETAASMIQKATEEATAKLKPAKDAIKQAEAAKCNAISTFTRKCGPYKVTYTGERAEKEFEKVRKSFDDIFDFSHWFDSLFFF